MLRRILYRFCISHNELKTIQLQQNIDLQKAQLFIQHHKHYIPYTQTITRINKVMTENNEIDNKQHLKALWVWKYNLHDVLPLRDSIIQKEIVIQQQLDFLEMMLISYPESSQVLSKLIKYLEVRLANDTLTMSDARRISQINKIDEKVSKQLYNQIIVKLSKTDNPEQLSNLLMHFTFRNQEAPPWTASEKNIKKDIGTKMTRLLMSNLNKLTERQTGQILGNLLMSTGFNEQADFFYPQLAKAEIKTQQEFLRLISLVQQFIFLFSKLIKGVSENNTLKKILEILEIKRQKFKQSKSIEDALIENKYLIESIMHEPKQYTN